ncbi:PREDICTED: mismatch repair endonuclease PMS2 [Trachymyrmex septentrionalis]|uniref:mismatch repair endonuclease PMS2 n=1 Tax=Trachymyrmex septentrionalis TaxID=34720 RepID=UPI00084F17F4|nr:PREDICTED: mismatch repair endonuclease PMS2 [Trachymyrmex septentrionalis]XP_018353712.1 PREDICTED: mismatch repair endonuclease PMS2 [Trachymyrmex septentrionalis]
MDEPVATTEKSKKIEAINRETIHHICSGQVVLDLAIAIKELVENSLDSSATVIDVKLTDYGKTCISVNDNGSGVLEQDFEGLGLKHHTSKLREFTDLIEVNTFGFRGEALSSLCALSELSIVTRHASNEHGFKLEFDRNGVLTKKEPCAREKGTTIHVKNIFKNLPVRAKEFQKNLKKEYARAIQVLYSYCLVSTSVKITCSNLISGKLPKLIVATRNTDDVLSNVNSVFGKKSLDGIVKLELQPPDETILQEYNLPNDITVDFDWECYVSTCSHAIGRSSPDRQFFYVNGRPCDLAKVSKLINSVYHKYNNKQYPFVFFNLKLDRQCADVNVTPDKRTIFVTQERLILAILKFSLTVKWDKLQGNFTVKALTELNFGLKRTISSSHTQPPAKRLQVSPSVSHIVKESDIQSNIKSMKKPVDTEMVISIITIKEKLNEKVNIARMPASTSKRIKYRVQMEANQGEAEKELQKELTKDSFGKMEIIGQFNLGFIIARLEDDLFIIDQHATDEKFRFEKLSNETKLKTQKLIVPKSLNFSALNETILIEHQQMFENNGFTFNINEQAEPSKKIELIGMPVSGYWQFGQEDIEELVFLIREAGNENMDKHIYRPSRVKQMLASRACRSAVMIGTALNFSEMQRLITQMAQMQNPWSCPHGRPTIRHLLSLLLINK